MIREKLHLSARCEDCDRAYRVADPDRVYQCKVCGGPVRASDDQPVERDPEESTIDCEFCGAQLPLDAYDCASCGTLLGHVPGQADHQDLDRTRREVTTELRSAYRGIGAVTWIYRFGALAYTVATLFAIAALARVDVPEREGQLVVGLTTLLAALMLAGSIQIVFQPFLWTVLIAVVASIVAFVHLVGPDPLGIAFLGSLAWALLSWFVLVPTLRYQRVIARHRDLYVLHHASTRTRRTLKNRAPAERHERLLGVMHSAHVRAWVLSATAAVLLVLASVFATRHVVQSVRPQPFSAALAAFEEAWAASDLEAVGASIDPRVREAEVAWLEGTTEGHGWADELPPLGIPTEERVGGRIQLHYDLEGRTLSAAWALQEQVWSIVDIDLAAPPLDGTLARFVETWHASNPRGLAEFFSPENHEKMFATIESSVEARGWSEFPKVHDTVLETLPGNELVATLVLERGELVTRWHVRKDGRWGLHGLKFPRR